MSEPENTYRKHFLDPDAGLRYDHEEYSPNSYSSLMWELEREFLTQEIESLRRPGGKLHALDFAAGTGRITEFLENHVDRVVGLEISEAMAARARLRAKNAVVLCGDITSSPNIITEKFDIITAFRFFLNAEPALRLSAMVALAARLKSQESVLIFNNHGNLRSLKYIGRLLRKRRASLSWQLRGNLLSESEVHALVAEAGLEIIRCRGIGLLGGRISQVLPRKVSRVIERTTARAQVLGRCGQNQLYVVRRHS